METGKRVAAIALTARQRDDLLAALDRGMASTADAAEVELLRAMQRELSVLGMQDSGVLLPAGGKGLRLVHRVLSATGSDAALLANIGEELENDRGQLADDALVTVIFDAR